MPVGPVVFQPPSGIHSFPVSPFEEQRADKGVSHSLNCGSCISCAEPQIDLPTLSSRPSQLPPEILDGLPPSAAEAVASRRDLRWFNSALGNWRWIERVVPALNPGNDSILELGAGTGELAQVMIAAGAKWNGLDRAPQPTNWPDAGRWLQDDIFSFDRWAEFPVVVGNLIFHHFDPAQLAELGKKFNRHTRTLIVGDLTRGRAQELLFFCYARAVRANRVSLHDGALSIRAGFRREELPLLLGLDPGRWSWRVLQGQFCAYRLIAERR
jgi:hypothetical protein